MGWKPQFSGHNALGDPQTFPLAGAPLVENAIAVAVMEPLDSKKPQVAEFLARQAKYMPKTTPTTYSMHGYNAARLFVEALKKVEGEPTGDKIAAALESIKGLDTGVMGPITFSPDQSRRRPVGRLHARQGREVGHRHRMGQGQLTSRPPRVARRSVGGRARRAARGARRHDAVPPAGRRGTRARRGGTTRSGDRHADRRPRDRPPDRRRLRWPPAQLLHRSRGRGLRAPLHARARRTARWISSRRPSTRSATRSRPRRCACLSCRCAAIWRGPTSSACAPT